MSQLRQGKLTSDTLKTAPSSSYVAIDLLYHISSFSKVLAAAEVLDTMGSPVEKAAFAELKSLTLTMMNSVQSEYINMQPFLEKLSAWTNVDYCKIDHNDILCVWDDIVKLIMAVIPPLREVFLGQVSSNLEVPGWLNLMSRCFHAHFTETVMSLEEVYLNSLTSSPSSSASNTAATEDGFEQQTAAVMMTNNAATSHDRLRIANAMVLRRAPEILVVSVDSVHLSPGSPFKGPSAIRYPETFDLALFSPSSNRSRTINGSHSTPATKFYDLSTVVALEGSSFENLQSYFRITGDENEERWYRGAGFNCEEVSKCRVIEGNFYGGSVERRVHPRLLVYTRRDLPLVLERTLQLVTKAGQMRALGDVAFATAMTTENYGDARRCYEVAISLDEGLRVALQENLSSLEKIERTQRARVLEEQADLALANKRFREASELYSKGMMNAVVSSGVYLRVRDKLESVTHIIALDSACQFAEKGEEALVLGLLPNAKDLYSQAYKLNPEFLHLHTILVGIDKTVQMLTAGQRIADAQTAAKAYHYKLANHFYREAIALVPEKLAGLQSTLDSLAPLMQGEDALMRQKLGLTALEDKRYAAAIQLFTEAIGLLPQTQASCLEHAVFLCDRALAHYDLKDFHTAVVDCTAALALKPELAIAHFRLGAAQFGLDQFDLASSSYERALKCDSSLSESIKVKVRQVTTAREIQQRKQREMERAKAKEEEKRILDEKRARDDLVKKERAEKLAIENAEKMERNRIKEEERRAKAALEKELEKEKEKDKEAEKERLRIEKIERDLQKAAERERIRLEKEKERERLRIEKEQKVIDTRKALEEEKKRQLEFTAELERGATRQREAEREKEIEREKARLEREKVVIEREKNRREKLELEAAKAAVEAAAAAAASAASAVAAASKRQPVVSPLESKTTIESTPHQSDGPSVITILKREVPLATSTSSSLHAGTAGVNTARWSTPQPPSSLSLNGPTVPPFPNSDNSYQMDAKSSIPQSQSPSINSSSSISLKGMNSKVWTASKSSADTITRIHNAPSSSFYLKPKRFSPPPDVTTDFPFLGEMVQARGISSRPDDGQELGWSVRRTSPGKEKEPLPGSSSALSSSASTTNDIFSSMAERPAMSTDYTFKPSEKTIKAAEAKRLADSQQKAAAAAAAAASSFSDSTRGDFDEFLSNSSASYISNFSSSIRYNPPFSAKPSSSNGLFFTSSPTPMSSSLQGQILSSSSSPRLNTDYTESSGLSSGFSSSFSGLGFTPCFLSSTAAASSSSEDLSNHQSDTKSRPSSYGEMLPSSHSNGNSSTLDETDDDFSSGYFTNPLISLGNLDYDDTSDPLLMAIGGLSMPPAFQEPLSSANSVISIPSAASPQRARMLPLSSQSSPQHHNEGPGPGPGAGLSFPPSPSFSIPASQSRISGQYNGYGATSPSSSYSPKMEYAPPLSPQRPFPFGPDKGRKPVPNMSVFPNMASAGNLNASSSSLNGIDSFNMGLAGGDSSSDLNYFNGPQKQPHSIGLQPPPTFRAPQKPLSQSPMMFSPFRGQNSLSPSGGSMGGNTGFVDVDRDRAAHNQPYSDFPPASHNPSKSYINSGARSSSPALLGQDGIEADMLPESAFLSVAWLRQHGMHMYRWAGDAAEWTEYAMHLPPSMTPFFCPGPTSFVSILPELQSSGCKMWIDKETLRGREATFLVFLRGAAGQPSNACMNLALDMLSNKMKALLPQAVTQSQSFGSIGSNRNSPPPSQFTGTRNLGMQFAQPLPHTAWSSGTGIAPSFMTAGGSAGAVADIAPTTGQSVEEEERLSLSDEYYDPEDLARSLSLSHTLQGEGPDTDWSAAPPKYSHTTHSSVRPEPLKVLTLPGGYVQRWLEIPRDSVGLVIGQGGKKIKDLCTLSGSKIQFRVNKTAEREGRPGLLELQGGTENVDQGLQLVWDLLHLLGKEYQEIPVQRLK